MFVCLFVLYTSMNLIQFWRLDMSCNCCMKSNLLSHSTLRIYLLMFAWLHKTSTWYNIEMCDTWIFKNFNDYIEYLRFSTLLTLHCKIAISQFYNLWNISVQLWGFLNNNIINKYLNLQVRLKIIKNVENWSMYSKISIFHFYYIFKKGNKNRYFL